MSLRVRMRKASRQGFSHARLGFNNQDAALAESFSVPSHNKTYWVGLVSDGSTGNPLFSHTEVGANLMVLYAYRRIQELICSGMRLAHVPIALYPSVTEFLLDIMGRVMPNDIIWPYPTGIKDRQNWSSQKRFRNDYLAATLIGFITDGEDIIVFSAGDGVILIDDEINIIDQDDRPNYPAISINQSGASFEINTFKTSYVKRISIATDGLKHLMQDPEFADEMFSRNPDYLGLQHLLNTTDANHLMKDDCTAVTWEMFIDKEE